MKCSAGCNCVTRQQYAWHRSLDIIYVRCYTQIRIDDILLMLYFINIVSEGYESQGKNIQSVVEW